MKKIPKIMLDSLGVGGPVKVGVIGSALFGSIFAIKSINKPIIASVRGYVVGALLCDITVASENSKFSMVVINAGLSVI